MKAQMGTLEAGLCLLRAQAARRYASSRGLPGLDFARFGRRVGTRLLLRGRRQGAGYLISPVDNVRYWEFPFALSCLPAQPGRCLDVGSPRLFSLYVASRHPRAHVTMLNPDGPDCRATAQVVSGLRLANVSVRRRALHELEDGERFGCIWSLSVVEHIHGAYDDRQAMRWMFERLEPGGRLIVTVPTETRYQEWLRGARCYDTQAPRPDGLYFYARFYDLAAIRERLIEAVGVEPGVVRWFGERTPGRFMAYERCWRRQGYRLGCSDPREVADHYREFATWEEMPGVGICGLMFQRPR